MNKITSRIFKHPDFTPADKNIKIWRYMDFSKYVSLLNNSSLYFSRSDLLGDPFEGSWPPDVLEKHEKSITKGFQEANKNAKNGDPNIDESKFMSIPSILQSYSKTRSLLRYYIFINCWHINEGESDAMWKLYGREGNSIAIQTTYQKFEECFNFSVIKEKHLVDLATLGMVNYSDNMLDNMPNLLVFAPYLNKKREYRQEEEFRALIFKGTYRNRIPGLSLPLNIKNLIESVIVSPNSPEWFLSLVKDVTKKYGFNEFVINPSNLSAAPKY